MSSTLYCTECIVLFHIAIHMYLSSHVFLTTSNAMPSHQHGLTLLANPTSWLLSGLTSLNLFDYVMSYILLKIYIADLTGWIVTSFSDMLFEVHAQNCWHLITIYVEKNTYWIFGIDLDRLMLAIEFSTYS